MIKKEIEVIKNIVGDSRSFMFGSLLFLIPLFAFGGINGKFEYVAWLYALFTIYLLFKNAIKASEMGL